MSLFVFCLVINQIFGVEGVIQRTTMDNPVVTGQAATAGAAYGQQHTVFNRNAALEFTQINDAIAAGIARDVDDFMTLVTEADEANQRERGMKLSEAFRTYPKAMAWSIILSSSIIMEGYDTAITGRNARMSATYERC